MRVLKDSGVCDWNTFDVGFLGVSKTSNYGDFRVSVLRGSGVCDWDGSGDWGLGVFSYWS